MLSYCAIQGIHLIKKIFLLFYFGFSWSLVSYGSSFAICKTWFFVYIFLQNYLYKIKRPLNTARWLCWGLWLCQGLQSFRSIDNKNCIFVAYQFWIQNTLYKPFLHKVNNTSTKQTSFICNLAAPQPALGHCWAEKLTNSMLIFAFTYFDLKGTGRASQRGWVTKPSWTQSGVWTENLLILNVIF